MPNTLPTAPGERRHWRQRVVISHHAGEAAFIYESIWRTLLAGFLEVAAVDHSPDDTYRATDNLTGGDAYVWIGEAGAHGVPWAELRSRGVKTIYYQTEPSLDCGGLGTGIGPDEVWDFTHRNVATCRAHLKRNGRADVVTVRYVPPGYVAPPTTSATSAMAVPPGDRRLLFLGWPFYKLSLIHI